MDNVNGGVRCTPSLEVLVHDTWYSECPKNTRNESSCTVHSEPDVQRNVFPGVNQKSVRKYGWQVHTENCLFHEESEVTAEKFPQVMVRNAF